jgi:hypothetical protein
MITIYSRKVLYSLPYFSGRIEAGFSSYMAFRKSKDMLPERQNFFSICVFRAYGCIHTVSYNFMNIIIKLGKGKKCPAQEHQR